MGNVIGVVGALIAVATVYFGFIRKKGPKKPKIPDEIYKDHFWGPADIQDGQSLPEDDNTIKKFTINVSDEELNDLKSRLENTRQIESIKGVNFEYGTHSDELKKVVEYWTSKYDWRKEEAALNKFDHFKTQIEGLDVHFVHAKPVVASSTIVLPLLLVHGWPGSVVEFTKIIPMLNATIEGVAFEVIAPSIPGYGWSDIPMKAGFNQIHAARVFAKLMSRLGHEQFFYQGGDWGSSTGKAIAVLYPERVRGLHVTLPGSGASPLNFLKILIGYFAPKFIYENPELDVPMIYPYIDKSFFGLLRETGYAHIAATKPDSVGQALNDSPAGLAAFILEKFSTWVDKGFIEKVDGGLTAKFTYDELITNVMVYWTTGTITSSLRFYKEYFKGSYGLKTDRIATDVPTGIAAFPHEVAMQPRQFLSSSYTNITRYSYMPRGGHFNAFEEPQLLADDFRAFVRTTL